MFLSQREKGKHTPGSSGWALCLLPMSGIFFLSLGEIVSREEAQATWAAALCQENVEKEGGSPGLTSLLCDKLLKFMKGLYERPSQSRCSQEPLEDEGCSFCLLLKMIQFSLLYILIRSFGLCCDTCQGGLMELFLDI